MAVIDEKEKDNNAKPEKKKSRFLVIIIAIVGALIAGGLLLGVFVYFFGIPGVMPKMKSAAPPVYEDLDLGERVVNLSDNGSERYLRVRMVLEYVQNAKLDDELKQKNAPIMEDILDVLRGKSVADIRPLDKEEQVKKEILKSINSMLKSGQVDKIYFTDFLIQ